MKLGNLISQKDFCTVPDLISMKDPNVIFFLRRCAQISNNKVTGPPWVPFLRIVHNPNISQVGNRAVDKFPIWPEKHAELGCPENR